MPINAAPGLSELADLPHKIRIPRRPTTLVARPRLAELLHNATDQKLIVLTAPAGYGKTSLLLDFAHRSLQPVCWYTLDAYDVDPWHFLGYLTQALRYHFADAFGQTLHLLSGHDQASFPFVVNTFIREFCTLGDEPLLCLDDWHFVDHVPLINDVVGQIIARCPNSHVVLTSRALPTLPNQMLLAARRQVTFVDESQLRFSSDELVSVLNAEGLPISSAQAEQLCAESEGWISGVLLALQAAHGNVAAVCASGTALNRSVQRFLAEQVLQQQPPDIQQFLCETALLDELTVDACDAILGQQDAWLKLEYLLTQRLFVAEIAPGVLRYATLFRSFLQHQLKITDAARWRALRQRIAAYSMDQRQWMQAFDVYTAIADLDGAHTALRLGGEDLYSQGRLETLERAFTLLPEAALDVPLICLRIKVDIDRARLPEARLLIRRAVELCGGVLQPEVAHLQAVIERIDGNYDSALQLAEQASSTTNDPALLGAALRTLGSCQHRLGFSGQAIETLRQALTFARARRDTTATAQVFHELAVCYNAIGQLASAEDACRQAERCWSATGNSGRRALSRNSLALNQALTGLYSTALQTLDLALVDARNAAIPQYEAAILSSFGDIYNDLALWHQAEQAYAAALELGGTEFIRNHIAIAQAGVLTRQHQHVAAEQALKRLPSIASAQLNTMLLLVQARCAEAQGECAAGLLYVERAIQICAANRLLPDHIRAWVACARLHNSSSPPAVQEAKQALDQARKLCDQLGSDMVLVVETWSLRDLITSAYPHDPRAQNWLKYHELLRDLARSIAQNNAQYDVPALPVAPPALHIQGQSAAVETPAQANLPPTPPPSTPTHTLPVIRARYLGGDHVWVNDEPLSLGHGRPREILAYLLSHPNGATRTQLYRCSWGEHYEHEDGDALSRVIYRLRVALPANAIVTINRDVYTIDRSVVAVESDVEDLHALLNQITTLPESEQRTRIIWQALELYRGPFLPNSDKPWCTHVRCQLERRYRQLLRMAAEASEQLAWHQKALEIFHQLLTHDAANIAAHTGIMRCHIALGEPALAISQYRALTRLLNDTLGIGLDRDSEPERLYQAIIAA